MPHPDETRGLLTGSPRILAPSYQNGWVDFGGVYGAVGFYKDNGNRVWLRGLMKSGTVGAVPAFNFPVGMRPMFRTEYLVSANGGLGVIEIRENGDLLVTGGSNVYVSLNGVSFLAG